MKKITVIILALVICCGLFAACTNDQPDPNPDNSKQTDTSKPNESEKPVENEKAFTGTVTEVLDAVIAKATELDTDKEYGISSMECTDTPVDDDSCTDILGLTTDEFHADVESAIESKPNDSWFTHSVVVIKVKSGVDVAKLADKIIKNTEPARFGCLKPESIVGCYAGEYIVFSSSASTTCEAVFSAVKALSAIEPVRIDRTNDWSGGGLMG